MIQQLLCCGQLRELQILEFIRLSLDDCMYHIFQRAIPGESKIMEIYLHGTIKLDRYICCKLDLLYDLSTHGKLITIA